MQTDQTPTDTKPRLTIFSFIMSSVRPFAWPLFGVIFVAFYWAAHISLQPYIIKLIVDNIAVDPSISNMLIPTILYGIVSFAFGLNFRLYDYASLKFYPQLKANILSQATESLSEQSYAFFQNTFAGGLANKIKELAHGTVDVVKMFIDRFLSHLLAFFIATFTLMMVQPWLAVILVVWTALMLCATFLTTKKARMLSDDLAEARSTVVGNIVDRFSNIVNAKLFASLPYEKKRLNQTLDTMVGIDKTLSWLLLKVMTFQGIITSSMITGCLIVLVLARQSGNITIGDFALVLTLSGYMADIIWNMAQEVKNFTESYGLLSQGIALLNQSRDIVDIPNAGTLLIKQGEIRFKEVHFRYKNHDALFSDKSIVIQSGQKVGLVGYSGSGKSTFVNLILRLFEVNAGEILIDGQNIAKVTQDSLHQAIAMIPQDPTLFNRSLADNIRYGNLDASEADIITASQKAHAHEFIAKLPAGYNTLVGERGIKLSGGQRQRIAIARAMLKNAPILLMDEATSALDSVTENLIKSTMNTLMQNRTTVVIAHRLSTLLHMDRILVFEKGRIVEEGRHEELLARGQMYKQLWDAQVGGFIPDRAE